MRTFITTTTEVKTPAASTGSKVTRTPDILDLLLKMSPREAKAVMEELKKGKQTKDAVEKAYKNEATKPFTMTFVC